MKHSGTALAEGRKERIRNEKKEKVGKGKVQNAEEKGKSDEEGGMPACFAFNFYFQR